MLRSSRKVVFFSFCRPFVVWSPSSASKSTLQGSKAIGATPLVAAVKHNNKSVARRLIQDPNIDLNAAMTKTGSTPLLIAIKKGKDGENSDKT